MGLPGRLPGRQRLFDVADGGPVIGHPRQTVGGAVTAGGRQQRVDVLGPDRRQTDETSLQGQRVITKRVCRIGEAS